MGKPVTENIAFVRGESLDGGTYAEEPNWKELKEISFMQFYKGIEERNWRSPFFKPASRKWKIQFFEDCGRLFRPSYLGYRAVIKEKGKPPVYCNLTNPGADSFSEDVMFPREADSLTPVYRTAQFNKLSDYGYLQVDPSMEFSEGVCSCLRDWDWHTNRQSL